MCRRFLVWLSLRTERQNELVTQVSVQGTGTYGTCLLVVSNHSGILYGLPAQAYETQNILEHLGLKLMYLPLQYLQLYMLQ